VVVEPPAEIKIVPTIQQSNETKIEKMYFLANTRVYKKKSNLEGPLYGPFESVVANTTVTVKETDIKNVVEITTESGVIGFVRKEKLRAAK